MKINYIAMLVAITFASSAAVAADVNPKDYKEIRIERNLSKATIDKSLQKLKTYGIEAVVNPKFDCKSIGYSSKDLVASGTMYGTNRKDGGIDISGTGDFKAYSYARYEKNGKTCREKTYTKAYDPDRYGKYSMAAFFK